CGGPTAVVNVTLAGFVGAARRTGGVVGIAGGPAGLAAGSYRSLDHVSLDEIALRPGAWLGAGRHPMSGLDLASAASHLAEAGIHELAVIGGNGSMHLAGQLRAAARAHGRALSVVGIPKTVDNDLLGTDHSPGFLTAASYLRWAVGSLWLDHVAMRSIERVRIIETLGRDTGWLAMSAAASRRDPADPPHLVYVPERPFAIDEFLADVDDTCRQLGSALVVVAEGAAPGLSSSDFGTPSFDRPIPGGVSHVLAAAVRAHLHLEVRVEVLGLIQRSARPPGTTVDVIEAEAVGRRGAELLAAGVDDVMVTIERGAGSPYSATFRTTWLAAVAGQTRRVPDSWVPPPAGFPTELQAWLEPMLHPPRDSPLADLDLDPVGSPAGRHPSAPLEQEMTP
ncbi:MAG: 6-phosphofructokinase, partial [Acidimicrobiales bacterium]